MSKLYKRMTCPICNCATVKRDEEIYHCMACDEEWKMVTNTEKIITVATDAFQCKNCGDYELPQLMCPTCSYVIERR